MRNSLVRGGGGGGKQPASGLSSLTVILNDVLYSVQQSHRFKNTAFLESVTCCFYLHALGPVGVESAYIIMALKMTVSFLPLGS